MWRPANAYSQVWRLKYEYYKTPNTYSDFEYTNIVFVCSFYNRDILIVIKVFSKFAKPVIFPVLKYHHKKSTGQKKLKIKIYNAQFTKN